jgi:hypothetical protein
MTWLVIIVVAMLIPEILSTVLDSRLGRAAAARLESEGRSSIDQVTADRLRYLEGEVDRLSEDVRKLTEESEFLHELLVERQAQRPRQIPTVDRDP